MKNYIFLIIGIVIFSSSCTFDECTSRSLYLTSFDNFINEVEKKHNDYSEDDWKEIDVKFEKLTKECYKKFEKDFSKDDKKRIVKNGFKYTVYRVKSELPLDFNFDEKDWDGFFDNVDGFIDKEKDFVKVFEKIVKDKDFQKAGESFKKGMESLGKGLDKFGKELDKVFKDFEKKDNR